MKSAWEKIRISGGETPTAFEIETAMALRWFADEKAAYAILEAGLGGKLDSTHAAHGKTAIISNVGMDHMEYLGADIPAIAECKAGIMEEGGLLLTGAEGVALETIKKSAAALGASVLALGENIHYFLEEDLGAAGQIFTLQSPDNEYRGLKIPLLGRHQLSNAALAAVLAERLNAEEKHIREGLAQVFWPGRLEFLPCRPPVLLDGAHNPPAMKALAAALKISAANYRVSAIIGMLDDKLAESSLEPLLPLLNDVIVTRPPLEKRSLNWDRLLNICRRGGVSAVAEENLIAACEGAKGRADSGALILICGSLSLIAPARKFFLETK
jgi:dihydrofolate synthase/folylpolyglutamate synthase